MSSGGLDRPQIGQVLHETYTLERVIGEGGVGVVYEASHRRLSRRFAVKVLQPAAAAETEGLERFRREAEVTSKLGHPNIIEIVDFNITPHGDSYLVMELLRGESLQTRLDRVGALALEQVASILKQTTSALQAAHDQGIIHRDLKPENIFLCQLADRDDHVKVLDFGMSKMVGLPRLTRTNMILGTPFYMSPEQAEGRSAATDVGADQFSLGVMLYTMLCGRVPFEGGTVDEVLPDAGSIHLPIPRPLEVIWKSWGHPAQASSRPSQQQRWIHGIVRSRRPAWRRSRSSCGVPRTCS